MTAEPIKVERVSVVVPAESLEPSVAFWTSLLGAPTFVDDRGWAQFDVGSGGGRLAVGAAGERPEGVTVMVKVSSLDDAVAGLRAAGVEIGDVEVGAHERKASLRGPAGEHVVLYAPS